MQYRLVDNVVVAVPAPDGLEAVDPQVREQSSIEALDLFAAVERVAGTSDDVVLGVSSESLDDRSQVAGFLGPVVTVHERVHLRSSHPWCDRLLSHLKCSLLGITQSRRNVKALRL